MEFHICLGHLKDVDSKDGLSYAVSWAGHSKKDGGKLAPQPVSPEGTVEFNESFIVKSKVTTKSSGKSFSWLELKVSQLSSKGKEKTYDKLVLNLVQCSEMSGTAKGPIIGKHCSAIVTVQCRTDSQPRLGVDGAAMPHQQSILEQRLDYARSQLSDLQDRDDVLLEELSAREEEVEMLQERVQELRQMDQELRDMNSEAESLKKQLAASFERYEPEQIGEKERSLAELEEKMEIINARKQKELVQLDKEYAAEIHDLEQQIQAWTFTDDQQEEQIQDLREKIASLKKSEERQCGCPIQ